MLLWLALIMRKKSAFRILLPVILLTLIAAIVFLSTSWYVNRFIRIRLQNEFSSQTGGAYDLTIGSLKLNLLLQSISFRNVSIKPVSKDLRKSQYRVSASVVALHGVNTIGFLRSKNIHVDRVNFKDPVIEIIQGNMKPVKDTSKTVSLYSLIDDFAESLTIDKLEVSNFDFKLFNDPDAINPGLHSRDNHFTVINLFSGRKADTVPSFFTADSIALRMNRFSYTTSDSLYSFEVGTMNLSYRDSLLRIDSVKVIPNYSKRTFGAAAGEQTDRFKIFARTLLFSKIDLRNFLDYQSIIAKKAEIIEFNLHASRDKNYKREYNKPKPVQTLLRELPGYLKIDSVIVTSSTIVYEEIAEGKNESGKITFNDINGNFIGLTNDSALMVKGTKLILKANCLLMNEGKLYAVYSFPLEAEQMEFDCSGFLTEMPMVSFNKAIAPLTGISIREGIIDTMDFSFHAGEDISLGKMKFLYHDLKLEPQENEEGDIKLKDRLNIFVANTFILKESNPRRNKPPTFSSMEYKRNKERFIFNYTWKTLFSGIKETIGIPDTKKNKNGREK